MPNSSAEGAGRERRLSLVRVAAILGIMLAASLPYAKTLLHPPVWDDIPFVFQQDFLMDCGNLRRVVAPENFLKVLPFPNSARPVWLASVLADTCLGGGRTYAYRLSSVFWHAVGAALLGFLAWTLSRDRLASVAAALVFAVHPVHTEAVDIIAFRGDLLCLSFLLAALVFYREGLASSGTRRPVLLGLSVPLFGLALLSKEMGVVLPLLAVLGDALIPLPSDPAAARAARRRARGAVLSAYLLLLGGYLVFRSPRSGYAVGDHRDFFSVLAERVDMPFSEPSGSRAEALKAGTRRLDLPPWAEVYTDPWKKFLTMSRVFGSYLRLLLWPHPLQSDYSPEVTRSGLHPGVWASWAAWLALFGAAWRLRRSHPLAALGLWWVPAALLPVSGLVAIYNLQAERYLLIASAGFCLAAGALGTAGYRRLAGRRSRAAGAAAFVLLLSAGAALTASRNRDYRSARAFFEAAKAADPGVARMRLGLALTLAAEGDKKAAEEEFLAALSLHPRHAGAQQFYGTFLMRQKRVPEALARLEAAASLAPGDPDILFALGLAYWLGGQPGAGLARLRSAADAAPRLWVAREFAGTILLDQGRAREAAEELRAAALEARWRSVRGLYHLSIASRKAGLGSLAKQAEQRLQQLAPDQLRQARRPHPPILRPDYR